MYLGILGFSVLVAGLDFLRRRAGKRVVEAQSPSARPDPQPEIAALQVNPVAESRTVAPRGGVAYLPDLDLRHAKFAACGLPGRCRSRVQDCLEIQNTSRFLHHGRKARG